jgi:outer membrane lipoprotein-sorting protein
MAGTRHAAWLAVLLSGWLAGTSAGDAQTIPLPRPAPFPKEGTVPDAPKQGPLDALTSLFNSVTTPFKSTSQPPNERPPSDLGVNSAFDPTQRALANKVSNYLSNITILTGNFVQIGPDGRRTTGQLFIQKPGKVRFDYDPPSPIDIIADGQSVAVHDRKLNTNDLYQLSQTPLRYLLADRIDLLRDTNVVAVSADETFVTITIEEKTALVGTSRLMVMFDAKDFHLKRWTITDPQGLDTTVALSNLDSSKRPDPSLFKIDYTRYVQ